jgi:hypothetical protein
MKEFPTLVTQGLPIALIILFILFPTSFARVSSQPLGKCLAVAMIIYYTSQEMMHGLIICLLTILYYQREIEEGFLSKSTQEYVEFLPKPSLKEHSIAFEENLEKDFTSLNEAYPDNLPPIKKVSEQLFRRDFCHKKGNHIEYRDQKVKNSLVAHVYPELTFREGECNPCDRTCHFTINRKHDAEEDLQSKSSKYSTLADVAKYLIHSEEEAVVVFKKEVATKLSPNTI